ncbi:BPSL0761 family protein [Hydrogenophaga sp.]|uniref:BPSL0761 family protein n=1 Tax=Hydrogenophaga sp. TaxID=1904254 RepID=UPI00351D1DAB
MTMPDERARALRFAGEVLREMLTRDDVPADLKLQARSTLRHYPAAQELQWMVRDMAQTPGVSGEYWLAAEDPPPPGVAPRG